MFINIVIMDMPTFIRAEQVLNFVISWPNTSIRQPKHPLLGCNCNGRAYSVTTALFPQLGPIGRQLSRY